MSWSDISKDLHAGTVGGVAGIVAGHPLDTIKVRLQTACVTQKPHTFVSAIRHIRQSEGPKALYRGLLSPILSNAPINAVVFGVHGSAERVLLHFTRQSSLTPREQFMTGASAGFVQTMFAAPSEHVKIQMQTKTTAQGNTIDFLRQLYKNHGMKGLCRGWQVCLARDVPAFGVYFSTYEMLKQSLCKDSAAAQETWKLLLAGGVAGSASWLVTQPIDVVKSCVQSQRLNGAQKTAIELVKYHLKHEGPHFFMKGFEATMLRAFPVSAVTFLVYEKTIAIMS